MRAKDTGESERRSLIERIEVEERSNITSPEREQTSGWSPFAREFVEP